MVGEFGGYAACAERILTLYKDNQHGYGWIADELNRSGWSFRDRWGKPCPFTLGDVRRVVSNWREYAGSETEQWSGSLLTNWETLSAWSGTRHLPISGTLPSAH